MMSAIAALSILLVAPPTPPPGDTTKADFFEAKVRPILVQRCGGCHGERQRLGGLNLTSSTGLSAGGRSGSVVSPGDLSGSRLWVAIRRDGMLRMPPDAPLAKSEVDALGRWIQDGAVWPESTRPPRVDSQTHWAYRPVRRPSLPPMRTGDWGRSPIDRIVMEGWDRRKLRPAPDADPLTLLRRVSFDLIGLPPSPPEVQAFEADRTPDALGRVVDRLLSSPEYGERWGRHWLDITYWADTTGVGRRAPLPDAWRYRDYVVEAFNKDKPYDQFVREQIAGDLLPASTDNQRAEQLVATGYLAIGPWPLFVRDEDQLRLDVADLQVDLIGRGLLGQTTGCARCHDHKFDPIPTRDYYALAGILLSSQTLGGRMGGWTGHHRQPLPGQAEQERYQAALSGWTASEQEVRRHHGSAQKELDTLERAAADPTTAARAAELRGAISRLKKRLDYLGVIKPEPPGALALGEAASPGDAQVRLRGEPHAVGERVPRGFLSAASWQPTGKVMAGSGRRELAEWVVHPRNPLTARVWVNRIWHHLFGAGLVRSVDNFGARGELPSHPKLLDYLASRLIELKWSTKSLIREIVLCRTYQLSSEATTAQSDDPENRWLTRQNRRRLQGEALRDAWLFVSGRLDRTRGGPTLPVTEENLFVNTPSFLEDAAKIGEDVFFRRAVYQPLMRGSQFDSLDILSIFDYPGPDQITGARMVTNVAPQALYLLNSPFIRSESDRLARRVAAEGSGEGWRIQRLHQLALGRSATPTELAAGLRFIERFQESRTRASVPVTVAYVEAWSRYCQAILVSSEFLYLR